MKQDVPNDPDKSYTQLLFGGDNMFSRLFLSCINATLEELKFSKMQTLTQKG
jgi:hypothetical protein